MQKFKIAYDVTIEENGILTVICNSCSLKCDEWVKLFSRGTRRKKPDTREALSECLSALIIRRCRNTKALAQREPESTIEPKTKGEI